MFVYTAQGSWPKPQAQMDWVDSVIVIEQWLTTNIGINNEDWVWIKGPPNKICVAFTKDKYRTLFLLTWA